MGKIEDKKKQKKEALLVSAMQLFTEKGIAETSISEIAKNAKMAKGTFYLYYKDKYEIRDHLVARKANEIFENAHHCLREKLQKVTEKNVEDCIIYLVENIIDQFKESPVLLKFIAKNLSWGVFSNIRIRDLDNRNCMDVFDELLQYSDKRYRQKELMIYMIVELLNATCYNVILYHMPVEIERLKDDLILAIQNILKQFECSEVEQLESA
ncbi:MAG: TetR/AcrR family transcriptional regulator [Lachnospiraceae bacterium]|nr:TetR/AcrR family transcriptional regulator [Lachnospiraceae bacterium]